MHALHGCSYRTGVSCTVLSCTGKMHGIAMSEFEIAPSPPTSSPTPSPPFQISPPPFQIPPTPLPPTAFQIYSPLPPTPFIPSPPPAPSSPPLPLPPHPLHSPYPPSLYRLLLTKSQFNCLNHLFRLTMDAWPRTMSLSLSTVFNNKSKSETALTHTRIQQSALHKVRVVQFSSQFYVCYRANGKLDQLLKWNFVCLSRCGNCLVLTLRRKAPCRD